MTDVSITVSGKTLAVGSPYNSIFVDRARQLGGDFDGANWIFSARHETRIRELCREVYGTDGTASDLVTVLVTMRGEGSCDGALELGGRTLARVFSKKTGAKLGDGVAVIEGSLTSGGSHKYPAVNWPEGTVLEVEDVPRSVAMDRVDKYGKIGSIEIVEETNEVALLEERARLVVRIAEIDALTGSAS